MRRWREGDGKHGRVPACLVGGALTSALDASLAVYAVAVRQKAEGWRKKRVGKVSFVRDRSWK